jgi:hypothetical protein
LCRFCFSVIDQFFIGPILVKFDLLLFSFVCLKMDYDVAIDNLQRLVNMADKCLNGLTYMEILDEVRLLHNDAVVSIDLIRQSQYINDLVRALFVGYNIKFVAGSKESYIKAIRYKASVAKWRFKTSTAVFTKLDKIYDMEKEQILATRAALLAGKTVATSVDELDAQKAKERVVINTNRLRRLLKRYGVILADDFRRQVILDLVEKRQHSRSGDPIHLLKTWL